MCRSEAPYPLWDPDDPPWDALDRSLAWLASAAYSLAARSSTEATNDNPFGDPGKAPGPYPSASRSGHEGAPKLRRWSTSGAAPGMGQSFVSRPRRRPT